MTDPMTAPRSPERFEGHTPGPWIAVYLPGRGWEVHWREPQPGRIDAPICHMRWTDGMRPEVEKIVEADAKLLAAAPTLLAQRDALAAALRDILNVIAADDLVPESVSYMRQARAALAAADAKKKPLPMEETPQHFHSDACYAMGPGDTEVLVCLARKWQREGGMFGRTEAAEELLALALVDAPEGR